MAIGTALKRMDPFREWVSIQGRMNHLFRNAFPASEDDQITSGAWTPAVDIYESRESIEMTFEIPGVSPREIKVSFENDQLTVSGERRPEHEEKHDGYHRIERSHGSFVRSFTIPSTVDPNRIQAVFENGLLRLSLPKRPETQPRSIEVRVK